MRELEARLGEVVRARSLLVASDFDGTIAPIVSDPAEARPIPAAVVAMTRLAAMPGTTVAVVSGRALDELRQLFGSSPGFRLVGSHGAEFDDGQASEIPAAAREQLGVLKSHLRSIGAGHPGFLIEEKPTSIAFHYRNVPEEVGQAALEAVLAGPARLDSVSARHGKKVIELAVTSADKGTAIERLRERLGADAVVFIGDDMTDEDVFAILGERDLGIKVGPGATLAAERVENVDEVVQVLERLVELRAVDRPDGVNS